MSIAKPFTFTANTYAKASEANANFDTVYAQVNTNISNIAQNTIDIDNLEDNKANINGDTNQPFKVKSPTANAEAVNKQYLMNAIGNSIDYISGLVITKDSGSPDDTIIVSAGSCYDSTHNVVLNLSDSTSKQNDNQAAIATYYVYLASDNADGSNAYILIDDNSIPYPAPNKYRQIGYYTTDSDSKINSIAYYGIGSNSDKSMASIANNVMPDYANTESYLKDTEYQVDNAGYLIINNTDNLDDKLIKVIIKYNGETRSYKARSSSTQVDYTYMCLTFPIPKGASFKAGIYDSSDNPVNKTLAIQFFKCVGG